MARYYDLIETPKTHKTFLEGGANRLPQTDERVSVYFQKIDLVKYDRAFDLEGYPILKEYALQEDGTRYSHYLDTPDDEGIYQPDLDKIADQGKQAIATNYINYTQKYLDDTAKSMNYDGILSLCSYIESTNQKFKSEAILGVKFRDDCWTMCYQIADDVANGAEIPTEEEFVAMLPTYGEVE